MPRGQVRRVLVSRLRRLMRSDGRQNNFARLGEFRIGLDQTSARLFCTLPNLSIRLDIECDARLAESFGDVEAGFAKTPRSQLIIRCSSERTNQFPVAS
jgi:hypothetical protein